MNTIENAKWTILEANLTLSLEEQAKEILGSSISDYVDYMCAEKITPTGAMHIDSVGALWVEIHVEGALTYWYTNQREDLAHIMWLTASVESIDKIPSAFQFQY